MEGGLVEKLSLSVWNMLDFTRRGYQELNPGLSFTKFRNANKNEIYFLNIHVEQTLKDELIT